MTALATMNKRTPNVTAGAVTYWEKTAYGLEGHTKEARFRITAYANSTLRIQLGRSDDFHPNPYSVISHATKGLVEIEDDEDKITLSTSKITLEINKAAFSLTFFDSKGKILNQDDPSFSVSWLGTEVSCYKKNQPDEKFIGLGEKTGGINRAGKAYTHWNTDSFAYGADADPLYMSTPFYMGIHQDVAYGIFLDNTHKSVFNFGASNNRFIYFSAEDGDMDYYFIHEETVAGILTAYASLTGKMEMPPQWSLGYQQCRYSYYPETEVTTLAQTFRDKNMPADVIYLDIHHMEKYKVFTFDGEKFPDPASMIKKLKAKGFKVVVIMDPGIKKEAGYAPFDEGKNQDLFLKYPDGEIYEGQVWPGWCAFPDFTHEAARKWWAEKMAFYTDAGVDGFWTDMNEPASWGQFTPNLIDFHYEGELVSHRKARNIYGMQMARAAQEGSLLHRPDQRPFVLTRAGFSGIQRYAAAWTGDNVASEEHMLTGIRLVNSIGLSGIPFAGYDVGGFCGEASPSLFARWMSIAAFAPLYRAHSMINSNDAEPWAFGEEVEEISRNYMKLRYQMLPLIYASFYQSSQNGLPVAKSLAVDHTHDPKIYEDLYQNQYLFCDRLLIAPVESSRDLCKVYLPEGDWYYLYDDQYYSGNREIFMECPLNYLPVLVKGGSILPLQSPVNHTGEKHDGLLRLHVYKGKESAQFLHYEDDGQSMQYKNGQFFQRNLILNSAKGQLVLEKALGEFESSFKKIQVVFHGFDIHNAHLNGEKLKVTHQKVAFLEKLTDFDPLPDNCLPYLETSELPQITFPHDRKEMILTFD